MFFSIICTVYNTEGYLPACITSILNQSFKDFELILIDDGSSDTSLDICKKYEECDRRITCYTQTNQGPYYSRLRGINLAKGEYLYSLIQMINLSQKLSQLFIHYLFQMTQIC